MLLKIKYKIKKKSFNLIFKGVNNIILKTL